MARIANLLLIFAFVINALALPTAVAKREESNKGLPKYAICLIAILGGGSVIFVLIYLIKKGKKQQVHTGLGSSNYAYSHENFGVGSSSGSRRGGYPAGYSRYSGMTSSTQTAALNICANVAPTANSVNVTC